MGKKLQGAKQNSVFLRFSSWFDIQIVFQIMNKHTNFGRHKIGGHDAEGLKNFWEKVIQEHTRQREGEELRLRKSALNK